MPVTDISYSTQNSKTESISHIINKFESCTFNKDSSTLDEKGRRFDDTEVKIFD